MKKLVLFVAVACLLAACKDENEDIIGQYFFEGSKVSDNHTDDAETPAEVPLDGLVAYVPFEGDLKDMCGNLQAVPIGNLQVRLGHSNDSWSIYFPGDVNNYIIVKYSDILQMNKWTINLWFNYEFTDFMDGALVQMGKAKVPGSLFIGTNIVRVVNREGTSQYAYFMGGEEVYPGLSSWHMLTVSVKDSEVRVWLDRRQQLEGTLSAAYVNNVTEHMLIGASKWDGTVSMPFQGLIDDVRIYNRVLSDEEIQTLYLN